MQLRLKYSTNWVRKWSVSGDETKRLQHHEKCGQPIRSSASGCIANEADYGIALDGDGDRLMMVDRNGKVYDGDSLIYVIAKAVRTKAWKSAA